MNAPTESYLKVHYELRPAKQVERRMLIDAFQLLSLSGFSIKDYQYTGMGSFYFIDFSLFHRWLGFKKMLSVEYSNKIRKRVQFNKPFDFIEIKIAPIGDVIPTLSPDLKHALWLDYDGILNESHLADISLATTYLSVGSILLITVDIEPPTDTDDPKDWRNYFVEEIGLPSSLRASQFAESKLPARNIDAISRAISEGILGRPEVRFLPLFNFIYSDGHLMLTVGGMIGTGTERRKIVKGPIAKALYYRGDWKAEPCRISVPRLTRKERQFLDSKMPCGENWKPKEFELDAESVAAYREIYRFCPAYAEFLL